MTPRKKNERSIPALEDLPKALRMAIVRLMAKRNIDYEEALEHAALLLDINNRIFDEEVKKEANRTYKRKFMTEINKARSTIQRDADTRIAYAREKIFQDARKQYEIYYYCCICKEKITVVPNSPSHHAIVKHMNENRWGHSSCHEKMKNNYACAKKKFK